MSTQPRPRSAAQIAGQIRSTETQQRKKELRLYGVPDIGEWCEQFLQNQKRNNSGHWRNDTLAQTCQIYLNELAAGLDLAIKEQDWAYARQCQFGLARLSYLMHGLHR